MVSKYYNLAKPGIVYGNLLSTIGALIFASRGDPDISLLILTCIGTALIIGGSCVYNNIVDKQIDAKMPRTQSRALPLEQISQTNAIIYGSILILLGSSLLLCYVNALTLIIGIIGAFWYVVIYGIAKRTTHHSTLIGTIAGATPSLAGYTAVTNHIDTTGIILFMILIFWQMPHFYAIAIFRMQDYKAAHIPILSIVKGIKRTQIEIFIYTLLLLITLPLLTVYSGASLGFAVITLAFTSRWINIMTLSLGKSNVAWAREVFGQSLVLILVINVALAIDYWMI